MNKIKIIGLVFLVLFSIMQVSACFVAGMKTEGLAGIFYFILGGISCLFGAALDFLLLIIAVDVFGSIFGRIADNLAKKQEEEDEEVV